MAKAKRDADPMKEMRRQYDLAVNADRDMRDLAIEDWRFLHIPGEQWDQAMRRKRGKRPCYEFSILRSHWRQVCNDQKKARPSIKVRPVENGDVKGAEIRQGIVRNVEQTSNAYRAYDSVMEYVTACGFGAMLVTTDYSSDDAWDQDLHVREIEDPLNSVWLDPNDPENPAFGFIEREYTRDAFTAEFPKAEAVTFESSATTGLTGWFGEDTIRVVAWYRTEPVDKEIALLTDGQSIELSEANAQKLAELEAQGITVQKTRKCKGKRVVMSICSGKEEIDGPYELPFHRIPIVGVWANRFKHEGKWHYCGMVRYSRDPQKLVNYNLTTAMEAVAKVPKSPYLVTPAMLEGKGVAERWAGAAAEDPFFLPYTPDPKAPNGRPMREVPPDVPAALLQLASTSVDMLKATDGIFDASVGARSNETSGKAILARQQEGDTATFDYQDAVSKGIQAVGDLLLRALPKVYDTPRVMRVIGKDGTEQLQKLYEDEASDLSKGKYDLTVTTGPSYETMRMEFFDVLTNLAQGNPLIAQGAPDLIVKALDFPGADEVAERLKLLLPPQIQQQMSEGKEIPPEVMMAQQQAQQMMQQAQEQQMMLQQAGQQLEQEKAATDAEKQQIEAQRKLLEADYKRMQAELKAASLEVGANHAAKSGEIDAREAQVSDQESKVEEESAAMQAAQVLIEQATVLTAQQAEMTQQQTAMLEQIGQMLASQPRQAMRVVRDEAGRVAGVVPEMIDGA